MAGVVVIAGAGWAVGSQLRSPADEAASRQAPKPSLVTAPVKRQKLVSTVTVNGTLEYGSPLQITLAGVVGGSLNGPADAQRVTRAPRKGKITTGSVLMEVNGRPVFVLPGAVPMHRTLAPGVKGADVKQLQKALKRLGFAVPQSGVFDSATTAAVQRWYAKKGYRAQEPDLNARQTLEQLRQAVQTAEEALASDRQALDNGREVLPLKLKLGNARKDLRSAESALEEAEAQDVSPEDATRLEELARAVRAAQEEVLSAEQALAAAIAEDNATTPPGATPTPKPTTDKRLLQLKLDNARQNLSSARGAVSTFHEQARIAREKRLEELRKSVRTAEEAVVTADQALRQARQTSPLRLKVTNGQSKVAAARSILAEYRKTYGVSVPPGELVFLPKLPARMNKVSVKPGDQVTGKVGTVTSSAFAVSGSVEEKESQLLRKGAEAVIETAGGATYPASLTDFGGKTSDGDTAVPVVLTPTVTKNMKKLVGSAVTVRISIGSTDGEVLTVPVAAVITSADGKPRVQVEVSPDKTKAVEVRTGLTADGNVQVTGELKEGDRVVIGDA